jgi:hypothetical protein
VLLAARIILLLSVDPDNGLVRFVVSLGEPLVRPVASLLHIGALRGADGSILDAATVVTLIAWTAFEALLLHVLARGHHGMGQRENRPGRRLLPSP